MGEPPAASGDLAPSDLPVASPEEDRAPRRDRSAGLGEALAEISARQRELDAEIAGAQDFSRLEAQLRHITEQIETLRRPDPLPAPAATASADPAALERIDGKMLDLAQKLDAFDARLLARIDRTFERCVGHALDRGVADLRARSFAQFVAVPECHEARIALRGARPVFSARGPCIALLDARSHRLR